MLFDIASQQQLHEVFASNHCSHKRNSSTTTSNTTMTNGQRYIVSHLTHSFNSLKSFFRLDRWSWYESRSNSRPGSDCRRLWSTTKYRFWSSTSAFPCADFVILPSSFFLDLKKTRSSVFFSEPTSRVNHEQVSSVPNSNPSIKPSKERMSVTYDQLIPLISKVFPLISLLFHPKVILSFQLLDLSPYKRLPEQIFRPSSTLISFDENKKILQSSI